MKRNFGKSIFFIPTIMLNQLPKWLQFTPGHYVCRIFLKKEVGILRRNDALPHPQLLLLPQNYWFHNIANFDINSHSSSIYQFVNNISMISSSDLLLLHPKFNACYINGPSLIQCTSKQGNKWIPNLLSGLASCIYVFPTLGSFLHYYIQCVLNYINMNCDFVWSFSYYFSVWAVPPLLSNCNNVFKGRNDCHAYVLTWQKLN